MLDEFLAPLRDVRYMTRERYQDYKELAYGLIKTPKKIIHIADENFTQRSNTFTKARRLYDMIGVEGRDELRAEYIKFLERRLMG